jgi:hypothetical protein
MDKSLKLFIDRVTNTDLFGMGINNLASWALWKDMFETGGTIAIIALLTASRIGP